ncbi:hypothetical protein [Microbacterium yannicii]|uniref:hypothetical protein n=1 Tax=Microbacterium yannicii TaxID=671622 RepID=UPI0003750BD0|nr:hypothetical protein [Microbacterium yannicii]
MGVNGRHSLTDRSRPWRIALAALGAAWALATVPLPLTVWNPGSWLWFDDILDIPAYAAAAEWAGDPYIVFGALAGLSFLAIGLAFLPDLRRAGWGGKVMGWLIVTGAPLTVVSYINTRTDAPLHFLWGAEGYVLLAIGLSGLLAAFTAGNRWGSGTKTLLGLTLLFLILGMVTFGYYPHGSLVALGLEAVVVMAAAPRDRAFDAV